jgi:peroxiredoxin
MREVARRCTYLVDRDGLILAVWDYETGDVPDVDVWLTAIKDLNIAPRSG